MPSAVAVFFYGSFMSPRVLADWGYHPERMEVATLPGHALVFAPRATVVPSDRETVYGLLCRATHEELDRLYAGGSLPEYKPEAVLVRTSGAGWEPALCYIAPVREERPPDAAYLETLLGPAREHGFPEWYVQRLEGGVAGRG